MRDLLHTTLEKYLITTKRTPCAGPSGVRNLEYLAEDLGYTSGSFIGNHPLFNFLADNPGAIQAIIDWIGDQNIPEWAENLECVLGDKDEDHED